MDIQIQKSQLKIVTVEIIHLTIMVFDRTVKSMLKQDAKTDSAFDYAIFQM
jgi:hypothetical protein